MQTFIGWCFGTRASTFNDGVGLVARSQVGCGIEMVNVAGQLSDEHVVASLAKQMVFTTDACDTGIVDVVVTINRVIATGAIDPIVAVEELNLLVVTEVKVVDYLPAGGDRHLVETVFRQAWEVVIWYHFTYHMRSWRYVRDRVGSVVLGNCLWFASVELAVVIQIDIDSHIWQAAIRIVDAIALVVVKFVTRDCATPEIPEIAALNHLTILEVNEVTSIDGSSQEHTDLSGGCIGKCEIHQSILIEVASDDPVR